MSVLAPSRAGHLAVATSVALLLVACAASPSPRSAECAPATATVAASSTPAPGGTAPGPIVQAGAPVLRARAAEVDPATIDTPEFRELVARMIRTMREAPGVGLAAPQIGVPLRVIVLEDRADLLARLTPLEVAERGRVAFGPRVIVNPVVTPVGDQRATFFEGCLSVAGYAGLVERALEVEVRGLDERGAPTTWRVRGWPARILQHELDHLDGTLYVDRMDPRSFSTGEQARALHGGKPIAAILESIRGAAVRPSGSDAPAAPGSGR